MEVTLSWILAVLIIWCVGSLVLGYVIFKALDTILIFQIIKARHTRTDKELCKEFAELRG